MSAEKRGPAETSVQAILSERKLRESRKMGDSGEWSPYPVSIKQVTQRDKTKRIGNRKYEVRNRRRKLRRRADCETEDRIKTLGNEKKAANDTSLIRVVEKSWANFAQYNLMFTSNFNNKDKSSEDLLSKYVATRWRTIKHYLNLNQISDLSASFAACYNSKQRTDIFFF